MAKDRTQLKQTVKQELFVELSELQTKREQTKRELDGTLEKLDDQIELVKLKLEVIEKLQ